METAGSRSKVSEGSRWFGFRSQRVQDGLRELGCAENKVISSSDALEAGPSTGSLRFWRLHLKLIDLPFFPLLFCASCDSDVFPSGPNFIELLGKKQ